MAAWSQNSQTCPRRDIVHCDGNALVRAARLLRLWIKGTRGILRIPQAWLSIFLSCAQLQKAELFFPTIIIKAASSANAILCIDIAKETSVYLQLRSDGGNTFWCFLDP